MDFAVRRLYEGTGHVDYIKFSFPWSNLFSANVQLELDGLYVLLGPINDRPYEEKKDHDLENAIKQAKLRAFEQSTLQSVADQAAKNPGFFEKLGKYILNNIQITIRNVHIRYEDSITNGDYSFAVGAMLQSFTVHTTNDRWEESEADSSATILHKLGSLTDLSVYWNHYVQEADLVGKKKRLQSHVWKNLLKQSISTNRIREESFNHILRPVTVKAKVIMNNEDNFMMPRIYVEFSLPDIMCCFSRHQYLNLLKWIDASRRVQINRRYRKYHPNTPVRFNRKAWWHYAYTAIVEEVIRPHQWTRVIKHRKSVVRYGKMYKTHLEYPDNKTLQEDLKKLEADMDLCNIIAAREQAKLQFVAEAPERARKKIKERRELEKANQGWFSWILGGATVEPDVEIEVDTEEDWLHSLSEEERHELYRGVGYDENSQEDTMPKEYIAYKMQLRLKNVSLTLENYSKPILKMTLSDMLTSYENRPGGNGARVLSHTESFTIEGASVDYKLVSLLTSNSNIYSTDSQMFTLDYELRPLSIHADQSLKLNVRPVEIFYDQHAVSQILMFLQVPIDSPQVDINAIAREKLMDMVEYSRTTLLYAIEQQSTFHISVHMKSPYIVIPQKGTLHQGGNLLICDLGNFTVESDLLQKDNVPLHNATISELQAHLYDKFLFKISDVKVLLADSEEEWDMAQKNPNSEFHILPSTGLDIAFYKSVLNNNQQPQQKFDAMLQSLTLNVTDVQIVTLNNFIRNFPVPTTSTSTIDAMDVPPPQPDWRHIQMEMDTKQLKRMRRSILSRLTIDLAEPILEEPAVTNISHSTLDSAKPGNRRSIEADTDTYYSASDDSEDEMDKWSSYRKVKAVDDYITDNNRMQMFMRASIGEIVIQVSLEQNHQRREYLMFRLDGFTADMAYTVWIDRNKVIPCGIAFHARLRGIGMADKLHRGATGAYLDLLQTESENELISICYRQVKPECPDFGPVFKNIEHGATLTFNNLSIMFDQTGVCYLKKFLEDLRARMYPKKDTLDDNPFAGQSSMIDSSIVRLRSTRGSRGSRSSRTSRTSVTEKLKSIIQEGGPSSLIKIHVITCVHDISLHLRNVETKFSELHIKDLEGQFIARAKKMTFNCRLQKFFVKDLTPDTLYPNILEIGTDENPFFDLKVEQFKSDGMTRRLSRRSTEPLDYYARLHIGQLQVAFINKFFWEITRFFEPLKSPELSDVAYRTKESVSKQMMEITPATVRVALVVKAHIPTVVVPQHSQSRDLFFVKFGNLEVWNQFERKEVRDTGMSQEWNHFSAKLTSMQISKGKLLEDNATFVVLHHLVEPVNFTASFSLALAPFVADIVYDVSGELNLVKVNMLETDMKLVMDIMKQNFGEGAPSTKPDLAKPSSMKPTSTMDSSVTVIQHDLDTPTTPEVMPGTPYNAVVTLQGLVLCLYEETNGTTSSIEVAVSRFKGQGLLVKVKDFKRNIVLLEKKRS
ncbi:vacuolar protein sorting-associated protein 13A-like [Pecten maximus]|uniref:vacuolar protein sorting-associated protein 13A-like n=1 Tax=Pecten maximus TaxID=6579 RepID=UPI0014587FB9|nr:vacuolar protein sorting-associated protein 13A-like [Pecten maximus]